MLGIQMQMGVRARGGARAPREWRTQAGVARANASAGGKAIAVYSLPYASTSRAQQRIRLHKLLHLLLCLQRLQAAR